MTRDESINSTAPCLVCALFNSSGLICHFCNDPAHFLHLTEEQKAYVLCYVGLEE
jgi:hypothetical protein